LLAFVVSGAQRWVDAGTAATLEATRRQAEAALAELLHAPLETVQVVTEKRATFRCTPNLRRPPPRIAARLYAAGDHIDGPYPATLEGAVRSGVAAARTLFGDR
jgi:predicted NAD/FAD-dependent oxidoreductase